jgi:hypothetical protein
MLPVTGRRDEGVVMVRRIVVILSAAVMALVALPASADSGSISDKHGDASGCGQGAKADCDIVKATWGHASHHRLVHSVSVAGTIGTPASGMGALPTWFVDVPGHVGDNPSCDYFINDVPPGVGPNTSTSWKYYLEKCSNQQPEVVGPVATSRPNAHKIVIKFRKRLIGSPSRYGWAVAMPSDGDAPPYDRAPDSGFKTHRL